MYSLERYVEPTVLPITTAQAKLHCRVTHSSEDSLFSTFLIPTARAEAESMMRRTLCPTTWRLQLDRLLPSASITLPRPRILSLSAFQYRNRDRTWVAVDSDLYGTDISTGRVYRRYGQLWPADVDYDEAGSIRLDYIAGYLNPSTGTDEAKALAIQAAIPAPILAWLLLRVGTLYNFKEQLIAGMDIREVPFVNGLLDAYRVYGDDF